MLIVRFMTYTTIMLASPMKLLDAKKGESNTLIPVFVASRDASRSGSYMGLNATVNAQSMICPAKHKKPNAYGIKWKT